MNPRITVVMATYHQAEYLPSALYSVICQLEHPRVIVVVPKSDMESRDVLRKFFLTHVFNGAVLTSEMADVWEQRSLGLSVVDTPFVTFADSDDVMVGNWLRIGVNEALRVSRCGLVPVVAPSYWLTDEHLVPYRKVNLRAFSMDRFTPDWLSSNLSEDSIIPDYSITNTDEIRELGFYDGAFPVPHPFNFYALWLRMLTKNDCAVRSMQKIGFLYRQHKDGVHVAFQSQEEMPKGIKIREMLKSHYLEG